MNKILDENSLKKVIDNLKKNKKKIVLCHGVFDLFHIGHLEYFKEAKTAGDILIVSVTTNKYVDKAPGRPYFNTKQRINLLSSLSVVDYVLASNSETAESVIKLIKPNIYYKGSDYKDNKKDITNNIKKEINILKKYKGKILYSKTEIYSSSNLLNKYEVENPATKLFISNLKRKYSFNLINKIIDKASKISVLVVGETIFDKFTFCNYLGRSGKENILTVDKVEEKTFLGGCLSLGKHICSISKKVTVCSVIGRDQKEYNFIKNNISKNMDVNLIKLEDSPTIIKEKIVELSDNLKLLGIYRFKDSPISKKNSENFKLRIFKELKKNHIMLISDYGHGLISKKLAQDIIKKRKKDLFVNTQLNAANFGYHTIGKYVNSSFAVINETELRHELRNRNTDISKLLPILSKKLNIKNLIVTAGAKGSFGFNQKSKKINFCPAFTNTFKDKIGAGDCYMGIFSIIYKIYPKDIELAMFIASMATIDSMSGYGSEFLVNKVRLKKRILYTLK
tara:strand:+ start:6346 stop:7869 length:1524 start_codon:yes stop_codon:yes gene_type:complete